MYRTVFSGVKTTESAVKMKLKNTKRLSTERKHMFYASVQ